MGIEQFTKWRQEFTNPDLKCNNSELTRSPNCFENRRFYVYETQNQLLLFIMKNMTHFFYFRGIILYYFDEKFLFTTKYS